MHVVREDPKRKGLLYAGTENALFVSFDDGKAWESLQTNLPQAPVHWLTIQEHFNDLVVGTYGRGFWILDDMTPLQQLTPRCGPAAHLFAPRPAYDSAPSSVATRRRRARRRDAIRPTAPRSTSGSGRAEGPRRAERSATRRATVIRTEKRAGVVGMNRWWWDLRARADARRRVAHDAAGEQGGLERETLRGQGDALDRLLRHRRAEAWAARRTGRVHRHADRRGHDAHREADGAEGPEHEGQRGRRDGLHRAGAANLRAHERERRPHQRDRVVAPATRGPRRR